MGTGCAACVRGEACCEIRQRYSRTKIETRRDTADPPADGMLQSVGLRGNLKYGRRTPSTSTWSARIDNGASNPLVPALVTKSAWSTPSPLTPNPPTRAPLRYSPALPGKKTIPLFLSFGAPPSKPWVQGLALSRVYRLKKGPGPLPSMPAGNSGSAPKLIVRLVTAVPSGTWFRSDGSRVAPLK